MRLIDADALITSIREQKLLAREAAALSIMRMIDNATVFIYPGRRAEWLNFVGDYTTAECSECGELYEASDYEDEEHFNAFKKLYKYCPNCGAKMDLNRAEAEAALQKEAQHE